MHLYTFILDMLKVIMAFILKLHPFFYNFKAPMVWITKYTWWWNKHPFDQSLTLTKTNTVMLKEGILWNYKFLVINQHTTCMPFSVSNSTTCTSTYLLKGKLTVNGSSQTIKMTAQPFELAMCRWVYRSQRVKKLSVMLTILTFHTTDVKLTIKLKSN